jgi:ABC-2 type transport system permease protein
VIAAETLPSRGFSFRRVWAMMLRQAYLYKRTLHRWLDVVYWPTVDLVVWGFIALYLQRGQGVPRAASLFLGALILWDILFRAQQSVAVGFLEDVWSRNLLNIWASPLTAPEFLTGQILAGVIRVGIGAGVAMILAATFYGFNILSIGFSLVPFVILLCAMGWAIGFVATGIIMRLGEGADVLAWALPFLFQPFSAVFYPVSSLPVGVRGIAHAVPSSHVFEGMRQVIRGGAFPGRELLIASVLDIVYLFAGGAFFAWVLASVRREGLLSRYGE